MKRIVRKYKVPYTIAGNADDGTKNFFFNEDDFTTANRRAGENKSKRKRKPMKKGFIGLGGGVGDSYQRNNGL